jgi:hypothetical protein
MGLKSDWIKEVEQQLTQENLAFELKRFGDVELLFLQDNKVIINLISTPSVLSPEKLIGLQESYLAEDKLLIHLWQDVWLNRSSQVISRLKSLVGVNKRIYGRSTKVTKMTKAAAEDFLNLYHLQGGAGGRYHFGLVFQEELVAVASFSNKRTMKDRATAHTSAELIRFATKNSFTVIGGLSKLIKHYVQMAKPDDLMSYADRDWSHGKAYLAAGFHLKAITAPVRFYLDQTSLKRYSVKQLAGSLEAAGAGAYLEIFNTGNLKYVLDLS